MKHKIEVKRIAHYYHEPAVGFPTGIIIAIHGYAQLAGDFIKDFNELSEVGFHVFAPEALSKFYNKERKPVANWMTSHEREDEIQDYVVYIESVVQKIKLDYPSTPIHLVGFSQGVSTLLRWYLKSTILAESIHLIAGSIPEEYQLNISVAGQINNCFYYHGTEDRLVPATKIQIYLTQLRKIAPQFQFVKFKGSHEVPKELNKYFLKL